MRAERQITSYYSRHKEHMKDKARRRRAALVLDDPEGVLARERETHRRWRRRKHSSEAAWIAAKVMEIRRRAKRDGIPCNITASDIKIPAFCPILGTPLTVDRNANRKTGPSIDKIINERGYVRGNVAVISCKANSVKSDMTADQVRALLRYMEVAELLA